ncbi:phage tail tape measure protein [Desulfotignum balticum]|uniref:phage tail tape measure protein n=1 Tax=Desulfotignum balticum TaxID=115781 RepID=UPI000406823D|nr:phage tail tape measure protein [Desulfotignum balticum]
MADLQKTIEVIFGGVDQVSGTVTSISKKVSDGFGELESMTDPLANAHDKVVMLEAALGALAIGGMALAVNVAKDFDSQFREVTTLVDETGAGIDGFRGDLLQYVSDSTQGLGDINNALYQAISLGVDYTDSLEALATAEQLAVGGKANLAASTELLLGSLNAYGDGVDEATRYSDAFFTIVKDGKTTIPELAQYLSQVTGTAAAAEVPIETLGAAIAAITASGAPTSQAMTQIRQVIEALIKPTKQASDYAQELGLDFSAQALAADGLEGIMAKVYDVTGGNVDQMAKLFTSSEALRGALILSRDESGKFAGALEDMENKTGATATAFEKMADDVNLINQTLANNVTLTLEAVGEKLLDEYGDIATALTDVFKALQSSIKAGAFDDVFNVIEELGGDLETTLNDLAKNLPEALKDVDFSDFSNSIKTLASETAGVLEAFFGDVDLSTLEGLSQAIQKLVNLGTLLNEVTTGIVEIWQDVAKWLGEAADKAGDMDTETSELIGNVLGVGKVVNELSGFLGGAADALGSVSNLVNVLAAKQLVGMVTSLGSVTAATTKWVDVINAATGTKALGLLGLSYAAGHVVGTLMDKYIPAVSDTAQAVIGWTDKLLNFSGTQDQATDSAEGFNKLIEALANSTENYQYDLTDLRKELTGLGYDVENLPDEAIFKIAAEADLLSVDTARDLMKDRVEIDPPVATIWADVEQADKEITAFWEEFLKLPDKKDVDVNVNADTDAVEQVQNYITWLDETGTEHTVIIDVAKDQVTDVEKQIDDIPTEKMLEIQLQGDIDTQIAAIEAQAETAQTAFEYKADVDIAEAQANADILVAAYDAAGESVGALAESTSSMFGDFISNMSDLSMSEKWDLGGMVEDQLAIEGKMVDSQIALNTAQAEYMQAKTESMERGDAMIQIDSTGLEPALEMIMWQVIEKVQIRANEESADFLLGLNS